MFMVLLNFHNKIKIDDYSHLTDKKTKAQRQVK